MGVPRGSRGQEEALDRGQDLPLGEMEVSGIKYLILQIFYKKNKKYSHFFQFRFFRPH